MTGEFNHVTPAILVVDGFYTDPDAVREYAISQNFQSDARYFKGVRSKPMLYPYVKEEFERLLRVQITDWMQQTANGCFQITTDNDPLVWHSDSQDYAGAIYLNPEGPLDSGTSFWRNKTHGCRRPPDTEEACAEVYSDYNLTHPDDWELVDRVGAVYNRLTLWDAKLIHSANSYRNVGERLVQLFFFNAVPC